MTDFNRDQSPPFTVCDNDGRGKIKANAETSKYRVGDTVYLSLPGSSSREGPYVIATVESTGVYTLCLENGQTVREGAMIEEKDLEAA